MSDLSEGYYWIITTRRPLKWQVGSFHKGNFGDDGHWLIIGEDAWIDLDMIVKVGPMIEPLIEPLP